MPRFILQKSIQQVTYIYLFNELIKYLCKYKWLMPLMKCLVFYNGDKIYLWKLYSCKFHLTGHIKQLLQSSKTIINNMQVLVMIRYKSGDSTKKDL